MSRFKELMKKQEIDTILAKHPLIEESKEVQEAYLQGLVFLAIEDGNFDDSEKEYISKLSSIIGLDNMSIDKKEEFAHNATEEEFFSFISILKTFSYDIKYNFIIEVGVIAFSDGDFNAKEKELFSEYIEIFGLEDKENEINLIINALTKETVKEGDSFLSHISSIITNATSYPYIKKLYEIAHSN